MIRSIVCSLASIEDRGPVNALQGVRTRMLGRDRGDAVENTFELLHIRAAHQLVLQILPTKEHLVDETAPAGHYLRTDTMDIRIDDVLGSLLPDMDGEEVENERTEVGSAQDLGELA
ncbi:MAG: hypothetical protein IPK99_09575 [Flavobacteriales bacterium]|nr:hypothetical protein [Flavobacteriales bacterium]